MTLPRLTLVARYSGKYAFDIGFEAKNERSFPTGTCEQTDVIAAAPGSRGDRSSP